MSTKETMLDLGPAAAEVKRVATGVRDEQLGDPTPSDISVGALINHLLGLAVAFRDGAQKRPDAAPDGPPPPVDEPPAHWRGRLPDALDALVAAWREGSAWEGMATAGGVTMPAAVMGQVVLDELVVHGWDLARGTGQDFACDPVSAEAVLAFTAASAEPGAQREGLFGPVVEVADDASPLDRALGYAGRDSGWLPPR